MVLRPVSDSDAAAEVLPVFEDAKKLLGMKAVPLMLRFIANTPSYLQYLWEKMRYDLQSEAFGELSEKLISFSLSSTGIIYFPSSRALAFTATLTSAQRKELETLVHDLLFLNSVLFLFTLDLREDLKSAFTQAEEMQRISSREGLFQSEGEAAISGEAREITPVTSRMLAPLFGSTMPSLPRVEDFFSIVDQEMVRLGKTESYLKTRVELERIGLQFLSAVPYRMNSNYKVFMELVEDKYVAYDLLYLLTHVFPSEFPRLLIIAALMKCLLDDEKRRIIT